MQANTRQQSQDGDWLELLSVMGPEPNGYDPNPRLHVPL